MGGACSNERMVSAAVDPRIHDHEFEGRHSFHAVDDGTSSSQATFSAPRGAVSSPFQLRAITDDAQVSGLVSLPMQPDTPLMLTTTVPAARLPEESSSGGGSSDRRTPTSPIVERRGSLGDVRRRTVKPSTSLKPADDILLRGRTSFDDSSHVSVASGITPLGSPGEEAAAGKVQEDGEVPVDDSRAERQLQAERALRIAEGGQRMMAMYYGVSEDQLKASHSRPQLNYQEMLDQMVREENLQDREGSWSAHNSS
jgi:hypothetical protein